MPSKVISLLALILLALCLMSGGCYSEAPEQKLKAWKDLIKLAPEDKTDTKEKNNRESPNPTGDKVQTIKVKLYFAQDGIEELVMEEREISKEEGIARSTIQELLQGPDNPALQGVFPVGCKLRDINIKPDGTLILDFSSELNHLKNRAEEKQMIDAVGRTMAQFTSVKRLVFLIEGQGIDIIKGEVDYTLPIKIYR